MWRMGVCQPGGVVVTDALDQVALPASAYDTAPDVKTKAIAAVVWRYQRDGWTVQELRTVLEALGLA